MDNLFYFVYLVLCCVKHLMSDDALTPIQEYGAFVLPQKIPPGSCVCVGCSTSCVSCRMYQMNNVVAQSTLGTNADIASPSVSRRQITRDPPPTMASTEPSPFSLKLTNSWLPTFLIL